MDLNSYLSQLITDLPWGAVALDTPVSDLAREQYETWIAKGHHGTMAYLEHHAALRTDPRTLLEGARTLIAVAFPYFTDEPFKLPVSLYARGRDYHEVVRERLSAVAAQLPGQTRVCVDTAPLRERYWAQRAGLGFIGRNNQLIIPGLGSYCFLGFILSTCAWNGPEPASVPDGCGNCRRCVDACPGRCLNANGSAVNATRCLSYLTIEHRGELPTEKLPVLYGCDVCQRVCPHNGAVSPTPIADFHPSDTLASLTTDNIAAMTPEQFADIFRHSAIKRTKLAGLKRNALALMLHRAEQ